MFNTLKLDRDTSEMQNIREAYDPISARSSSHQACDRCHEKKLKCTGEKSGCDRCIMNQLRCRFTRCNSRASRRGKHNRQRSETAEPFAGSSSSTNSQRSRSRLSPSSQGSTSYQFASSTTPSTSSTVSSPSPREQHMASPEHLVMHDESGPMLDRIDPELFRLEDGFSFPDLALADTGYAATPAACHLYTDEHHHHHHHMPSAAPPTGNGAPQFQTLAGWIFNTPGGQVASGYSDPVGSPGMHEFDPYQFQHMDYRQQRWTLSESG